MSTDTVAQSPPKAVVTLHMDADAGSGEERTYTTSVTAFVTHSTATSEAKTHNTTQTHSTTTSEAETKMQARIDTQFAGATLDMTWKDVNFR
jgi:hypothetical protein